MSASPSEPPPKHVKLRHRALAYVRRFGRHHQASRPRATSRPSFADTGGARSPIHLTGQRRFSDSGGPRPVVQLNSKRSFADSNGVIRITSKRSFADSTGSNSGIKVLVRQSNMNSKEANSVSEENVNTRSRRTSRARKGVRKNRENRIKRRHRFLASLHNHGGHRFLLFCGCCVEQEVVNPAESSSFHWGVGFDDSYYRNSSQQILSNSTRFRLELCGLHVNTRNKEPLGFSVDISSVGARAASFDSGFGFTCASPVSCPPPLGLAPARQLSTTLQLRARDGTGSGKFTLHSGHSAFSSTGFKRKAPSSCSYPSYTPNTPPSPFMNDFVASGTFNNTRARSRVSVGCNGWLLNDDDPSIVGWHRHRSSREVNPPPITTHLPQLSEGSQENEADFDRELSPKRYKTNSRAPGTTSGVSSSSSPSLTASVVTSPKPPLVPRSTSSSPVNSRSSRVSIVLLSQDGSSSSSNGGHSWLTDSGTAVVPLPSTPLLPSSRLSYAITPPPPFASSRSSYSSGLASQTYDSALQWKGDSSRVESDEYEPLTKRRRSTGSSSNSSYDFGFGNLPRSSTDEVESHHIEEHLSARERSSFAARFSASLRLTRSHSPRTLKETLSPETRRRKGRRSRSHSASRSRSRRMFRKSSKSKSASSPPTPVKKNSRPSIVFIDCSPTTKTWHRSETLQRKSFDLHDMPPPILQTRPETPATEQIIATAVSFIDFTCCVALFS